jgi:hypothetical protein
MQTNNERGSMNAAMASDGYFYSKRDKVEANRRKRGNSKKNTLRSHRIGGRRKVIDG